MAERSSAQEDYETVSAMAERLKLTGHDKEDYIRRHMRGFGHKSVTSWVEGDADDEGGFFGSRKKSDRRRSQRDDDDDDF